MSPTLARRFSVFSLIAALPLILIACLPTPAPQSPRSPVASSALVLSSDGGRLAAVNPDSDSITLVDAQSLQVISEIPVGDDPRTVAFTPDGSFALVANHGSGTVSIIDTASAKVANEIGVGGRPYGIVADASRAYVSLSALAQIAVIDFAARAVSRAVQVEPFPSGLALAGDALYVTHLYSGRVTHIDLLSLTVRQVISTGADSNLSQSIALSPDGARAYLPQTRSNTGSLSLGYASTVLPLVSVLDL